MITFARLPAQRAWQVVDAGQAKTQTHCLSPDARDN